MPDPERAPLITCAFDELATGRFTKQEVIARVTQAGLRTRRGLGLSPQSFGQMMRNPIYVGKVESPDYGVSTHGDFELGGGSVGRVSSVVSGQSRFHIRRQSDVVAIRSNVAAQKVDAMSWYRHEGIRGKQTEVQLCNCFHRHEAESETVACQP